MNEVDFGLQKVGAHEKPELVNDVFRKVARRYDAMNDLMSFGTHRIFKRMVVQMLGLRDDQTVLDLAGGTGDMSILFAPIVGPGGHIVLADPNPDMLAVARERIWDSGHSNVSLCQTTGESLPFDDASFDRACISFGLRNFTDKDQGLSEIHRCLKHGGILMVLEFSKPQVPVVSQAYAAFQSLWPVAGQALVGESAPYQYLVDSIKVHPDQAALKQMFEDAGFSDCTFDNLLGGIAAIHKGTKL